MVFAQRVRSTAPEHLPVVATQPEPRQLPRAAEVPTPRDRLDTERDVVQRRLANFKAIQKKFQQDREEYYTRTMSEARATQWALRNGDNGA
jgi:hypothetical protein